MTRSPQILGLVLITFTNFLLPTFSYAYALINLNTGANTEASVVSTDNEASVDAVEIKFKEKGKFLALLPIILNARAIAHANGKVEIKYPWFAALSVDKQKEIETELKITVDQTLKRRLVGSVKASGEALHPVFTATEAGDLSKQVRTLLETKFGVEVF